MTEINDKRLTLDDAAYKVFAELGFKAANISKNHAESTYIHR